MIKILIVDDTTDKVARITKVLTQLEGVDVSQVTHESNVHSAKLRLLENVYDLMILDIALPERVDKDVERDGGIKLLDEITERSRFKVPHHIIGITEFSDTFAVASERFSRRLFSIIRYDAASNEWVEPLLAKIRHIIAAKQNAAGVEKNHQSHLAVVCALEIPELSAVRQINWNWKQYYVPNDAGIYYRGERELANGERQVIYAAAASRMGMPAAAVLASKMITNFQPKYLAMTGITAGVSGKTKFGDVIAADPSWDYGSGKWIVENDELVFMPSPHQLHLSFSIRNKLKQFSGDAATLALIREEWMGDKPEHVLSLHVGPLASGASVIADDMTTARVKLQNRNLLGIEMEAYAVFAAADEAKEPRPQAFALKSVVDFADGEKNDKFQKYSAYTSAQALKHLIVNLLD